MQLFHRTNAAEAILQNGFRDGRGSYLMDGIFEGVFFSDVPLDSNEGAKGDVVLSLDIPESLLADYEIIEENMPGEDYLPDEFDFRKPYREWIIPADVANRFGPPNVHQAD